MARVCMKTNEGLFLTSFNLLKYCYSYSNFNCFVPISGVQCQKGRSCIHVFGDIDLDLVWDKVFRF